MALAGWYIGLGLFNILTGVQSENIWFSLVSGFIGSGMFAMAGYEISKVLT